MTTINSIQDLMRILDENPEWLEEVRSRVLTRELMELPERFERFVEEVRAFIQATNRRFELMDSRFDRMEDSIGRMKSGYAERKVMRQADIIVDETGLTWVRNLTYEEIRDLARHGDTSFMTRDDIKSFRTADVIMESRDEDGGTHYIPVEISFTADVRGTSRALRNARFITSLTGRPAHPAVAGLRRDVGVRELFQSGAVHWYQLDEHDFKVG